MFLHIALVAEVLATIVCIHCIYGKKVECDVKTVTAFISILVILEIINKHQFDAMWSAMVYVIMFVYCRKKFRSSLTETVASILLCTIILTAMQFICISFVNMFIPRQQLLRNALSNVLTMVICVVGLPKCGISQLQKSVCRRNKSMLLIFGFILLISMALLLQEKIFLAIQAQYFIFVMPAVVMLLYLIIKWYATQIEVERMEEEIHITETNVREYESLLVKVRLRQHEFKNHIAAIFSAHYTYKTYEKLVQAQEEYCTKLLIENKYNNLLLLENNVLTGFLHTKFQEVETEGILLDYCISAKVKKSWVPTYYIIEMLGILFDNAIEALEIAESNRLYFEVREVEGEYQFSLRNLFRYVSYDEISGWFQYEKSEKGSGRGLGLFHLKCLCEEWKCEIVCRNEEIDQQNWIVFCLKVRMADNE